MREALEAFSGLLLVMAVLGSIFSGICFWIGGRCLKQKTVKLKRVVICAFFVSFVTHFSAFFLSALPILGAIIAFILGLALSFFPIKSFFHISTGKAAGLWLAHIAAQLLAVILSAELFTGGISYFLDII